MERPPGAAAIRRHGRRRPHRRRPAPFYERLGFVATGDLDVNGETILRLQVHTSTQLDPRS